MRQIEGMGGLEKGMQDHLEAIRQRLESMVADAEAAISRNGSILDYGMRIRRDTANEILGFMKTPGRIAAADAPARDPARRAIGPDRNDAARIEVGSGPVVPQCEIGRPGSIRVSTSSLRT
jgi:hypothetical protein